LRLVLLLGLVTVSGASAQQAQLARAASLATTTFEQRVLASADDAEEAAAGGMYLNSSDLELVYDGSNQKVGMRFTAVTVPKGATITRAYIQFEAKETQSEVTNLLIQGLAADNATTFTTASGNVSTRPRTAASVSWSPPAWGVIGEAGLNQRTPDLTAVIQEIVNRAGWASGNALALVVTGTGHRTARAWDSKPTGAPLLHVEYTTGPPPPNTAPSVNAGPDLTVTLPANAALHGTVSDDGLPNPPAATTANWTVDSGPGPVSFQNAAAADTQATFSLAGTYTLRLTASDSSLNNSDTTQITVLDGPPVTGLSVTPAFGPAPLAVTADASASTDTDGTPIASYSFDFGDGSAVVGPQDAATATHTYTTNGTYTATVTATDTAGLSSTATRKVTVGDDAPPVARMTVSPASGAAPLGVTANASASTDTDPTGIASYTFDFGDGTAKVGPQAGATATHTYNATGTFTATVTVTDSAGLASSTSSTVAVSFPTGPSISVFAGYYDTHHDSFLQAKPDPWKGSPNTLFVGTPDSSSGGWDTAAVMVTNKGSGTLTGVNVTVDVDQQRFALWGAQSVPAGQSVIFGQTGFENFDGSDTSPAGCYGCNPSLCITSVVKAIPVVHVMIGATTTNYQDPKQILNTQGADKAGCPDTGGTRNDESETWQALG
jgi:PKD repeat protein